jgi:hypothetical protein
MVVDSALPFDIDINPLTINFDTNVKIDIDTTSTINVGITVPAVIDTIPSETEVDIARSTVNDTASPNDADLTPAVTIIDPHLKPGRSSLGGDRRLRHGLWTVQLPHGQ